MNTELNMKKYHVTIDLRDRLIKPKEVIEIIEESNELLINNKIIKTNGYITEWYFETKDTEVIEKVKDVLDSLFREGTIYGGRIE